MAELHVGVCDGCHEQVPFVGKDGDDHLFPEHWLAVVPVPRRGVHEIRPLHFCSWPCVRTYAHLMASP